MTPSANLPDRLRVLAELLWDREDRAMLLQAADELEALYARPVGLRFTLPNELAFRGERE